jgi:pimeloyl-ACP methyl ester carboxylesterase
VNLSIKLVWIAMLILFLLAWLLWTPDLDRASLEAKYLAAPTDMTSVLGVKLHVRDGGPKDAPAVLMLHGFGSSLHTWEPWAKDLSKDMRVIGIDLPGSGLSSPDPAGDYSDTHTIQLILALLDQLGIANASVIGHSMGGRIAWTLAATHAERVNKLVLISPDGFASQGFEYGKPPEVPATMQLMRYTLPKWLLRMNLAPAYANANTMTDERSTRYHELMRSPGSREALLSRVRQTILVDPVPLLKRITAPTLLLWGKEDHFIPFANSQDYTKAIPVNRLIALEGVGHVPHEEDTDRALIPVRDFLLGRLDN